MRKKTKFLGMLGAGLMWMPTSAILAAQMNNAAMSVQQNQGIKGTVVDATGETLIGASGRWLVQQMVSLPIWMVTLR